jgi:hypothetical protein
VISVLGSLQSLSERSSNLLAALSSLVTLVGLNLWLSASHEMSSQISKKKQKKRVSAIRHGSIRISENWWNNQNHREWGVGVERGVYLGVFYYYFWQ